MRKVLKIAALTGGLSLSLVSSSALAGECGYGPTGPNCTAKVVTHSGPAPQIDPVHIYSQAPMGHLRSVQYLGSPSVNITRIHGVQGTPSLSDAPSAFTGGCTPESTHYCRQNMPSPAPMPAPVITPPAPAMPAPVITPPAPQVTERVVAIGGGYDPSKFTPRTYGSNELTPGIAHIPTSIVDRSHENAIAVLNGGMTQPQAIASGGTVPHPSMITNNVQHNAGTLSQNINGSTAHTMTMAPQTNIYPGSMAGDGSYYEQVSGPTTIGGMQATQVICKRQAPQVQVQSPVIGMPMPVPTAMPSACQSVPMNAPMSAPMQRYGTAMPHTQPAPIQSGRFASSRYGH